MGARNSLARERTSSASAMANAERGQWEHKEAAAPNPIRATATKNSPRPMCLVRAAQCEHANVASGVARASSHRAPRSRAPGPSERPPTPDPKKPNLRDRKASPKGRQENRRSADERSAPGGGTQREKRMSPSEAAPAEGFGGAPHPKGGPGESRLAWCARAQVLSSLPTKDRVNEAPMYLKCGRTCMSTLYQPA